MSKEKEKIKRSRFIADPKYRLKNSKWLLYSSNIARRILAAIEENENINRNALAAKLEVSPQYISKIVQGNENLSLETIAKISEALSIELITFPQYKYSVAQQKISAERINKSLERKFENSKTKLN